MKTTPDTDRLDINDQLDAPDMLLRLVRDGIDEV